MKLSKDKLVNKNKYAQKGVYQRKWEFSTGGREHAVRPGNLLQAGGLGCGRGRSQLAEGHLLAKHKGRSVKDRSIQQQWWENKVF